jgi:hypothetical protein
MSELDGLSERDALWKEILAEAALAGPAAVMSLMLPDPNHPDEAMRRRYAARREVLINAELERRRIGRIQRGNLGRMMRREPLVEP